MHLSSDDLQFLARLSKSPDGQALLKLLRAELAEADAMLRKATGDEMFRCQGRAQYLDGLIKTIESANQKLTPRRPTVNSVSDWGA